MAKASLYLDPRPLKTLKGKYSVKIKVTHQGARKYFNVEEVEPLTPEEFKTIISDKQIRGKSNLGDIRRILLGKTERNERDEITHKSWLGEANDIIAIIGQKTFSFDRFDAMYSKARNKADVTIEALFYEYIKDLQAEERIGTAMSYSDAMRAFKAFKPTATIHDINGKFLYDFQKFFTSERYVKGFKDKLGKQYPARIKKAGSLTTVGIYTRSLRTIYNQAITKGLISKQDYPFHKNEYRIPHPANKKRALKSTQLRTLWNYEPQEPQAIKAKDFFLISYLAKGMNISDIARLRQSNFKEDGSIIYLRKKTERRVQKQIRVIITEKLREAIDRQKVIKMGKDPFIFDVISDRDTEQVKKKKINQFTTNLNRWLKKISRELEFPFEVTTYYARHSFATVMRNSGASMEMISEDLSHSDLRVTQNYVGSLEDDQQREYAEIVANFGL